jgi:RNA polymerase sigma-70 factor (ECF subfamily)
MTSADRDNDAWVRALATDGPDSEAAQRDLRIVIVVSLRRALASRGVGETLCEDVAQEALVRVRERLSDFRGESRFTTWALAIATRIAFDELRHKHWKDISLESVIEDAGGCVHFEPCADPSQERSLVRERVLYVLAETIEQELTERQRSALAAELQGMPHAEIAAQLGIKRNALYKLTHDARKRMKARLEASGISAADVLWVFE